MHKYIACHNSIRIMMHKKMITLSTNLLRPFTVFCEKLYLWHYKETIRVMIFTHNLKNTKELIEHFKIINTKLLIQKDIISMTNPIWTPKNNKSYFMLYSLFRGSKVCNICKEDFLT